MFDIYYIGDNKPLAEVLPFAQSVDTVKDIHSNTRMYWLIEPNTTVTDYSVFDYRPAEHQQDYTHVWKWDNRNYGGINLIPADSSEGTVEINTVVCKKQFDILHTKTPGQYFVKHPHATHVWCVDKGYTLNKDIDWAPGNFEPDFVHYFHLRDQLEDQYPAEAGGIQLYPRNWKQCEPKYHKFLDAGPDYPVLHVKDVEHYAERDRFDADYVWLIDEQLQLNTDNITWTPNPFEADYIHSFRTPYQLTEKYPHRLGGIRLVPRNYEEAFKRIHSGVVIHPDCPVKDLTYDVFYVSEDEFTDSVYTEYAQRSRTDWFWMVDREYEFNGNLTYIPHADELDCVHVFKIPGQLEERYPVNVVEPWDTRCGGVRLVHKDFDITRHKYQLGVNPAVYDVYYAVDPTDWQTPARKSTSRMFWLIDKDYVDDQNTLLSTIQLQYTPPRHEQSYALNWQIPGSLAHRYPDEQGGIWLIPSNYTADTQIKYKGPLFDHQDKASITKEYTQYPVKRVKNPRKVKATQQDSWVVDERYRWGTITGWAPTPSQIASAHVFHLDSQLMDVYTGTEGGVWWIPCGWDKKTITVHTEPLPMQYDNYPVYSSKEPHVKPDFPEACWCVHEDYVINDIHSAFSWRPYVFEAGYTHVFHIKAQLTDVYTEDMGGVYWHPRSDSTDINDIKIHTAPLQVESCVYDSYYVKNPTRVAKKTKKNIPGWYIDELYRIEGIVDVIPYQSKEQCNSVHVYHVRNQLTHKYTENMGGVYWIPENWDGTTVVHDEYIQCTNMPYNKFSTDAPEEQISNVTGPVWCVHTDYELPDVIWDIPYQNLKEKSMVHCYHVKDQLGHIYPENMGGVYWIPEKWNGKDIVVHEQPLESTKNYTVYRVEDPTVAPDTDQPCWAIDQDYCITEPVTWAPDTFERDSVHIFHINDQLTHKYVEHLGGAYWYPADKSSVEQVIHPEPLTVNTPSYPVYRVADPSDYSDIHEDCWLVDREYYIGKEEFDRIPWQNSQERECVHVYQVKDQLAHKYPAEMGGVYWVPAQNKDAELFIHTDKLGTDAQFSIYNSVEEGLKSCTADWYWVIESGVRVHEDFDFTYNPEAWDSGKPHVWQKLNPITDKQYDYSGIGLYPTKPNEKGRPKYMREPACWETEYPVYYLNSNEDYIAQLEIFDAEAEKNSVNMYWVIDPFVKLASDFELDYYPTQYDRNTVHVFTDHVGEHSSVRLYPTGQFTHNSHTEEDVLYNKFDNLKQMPAIATEQPIWPVHNFRETTVAELSDILSRSANAGIRHVWTVDTDVVPYAEVLESPVDKASGVHSNAVNAWQILVEDQVQSNGGLRFWPTDFDTDSISDEDLITNDFDAVRYIDLPGSTIGKYPVHYLVAEDDIAEQLHGIHADEPMFWAVDPGTTVRADFDFRYYPSKWDEKFVHVFANHQGEHTGVRLYPSKLFNTENYTVEEITNNSFKHVKLVDQVASAPGQWPVAKFNQDAVTVEALRDILFANRNAEYVWTADPNVTMDDSLISSSFAPRLEDASRPHVWKLRDGEGFGGVRLWPTAYNPDHLTDEQLRVSDIEEQQLVEGGGYVLAELPVYELSHLENFHDQLKQFDEQCEVSMFWVLDPFTELAPGWDFQNFRPNSWDEKTVHIFKNTHDEWRGARLYPKGTFTGAEFYQLSEIENNSFAELKEVALIVTKPACYPVIKFGTGKDEVLMENFVHKLYDFKQQGHAFVWSLDTDVILDQQHVDNGYQPALQNINKVHTWQRTNPHTRLAHSYGGLRLWPTNRDYSDLTTDKIRLNRVKQLQYVKEEGCTYKPFEVVFLSYHETYAETAYKRLQAKNDAHWVKDIEGIFSAHKKASETVSSAMFWVVDADAVIEEDFNFNYIPDVYDQEVVHVWASKNPITGDEYGYGGVKLFNTQQVREANSWGLDFTTGLSSRFKAMPEVSCVTQFNTDAYSTWRSAFRECVKLTMNGDDESKNRLEGWLHPVPDADFRAEAKLGAELGKQFAEKFGQKPLMLAKINDYEWLEQHYADNT